MKCMQIDTNDKARLDELCRIRQEYSNFKGAYRKLYEAEIEKITREIYSLKFLYDICYDEEDVFWLEFDYEFRQAFLELISEAVKRREIIVRRSVYSPGDNKIKYFMSPFANPITDKCLKKAYQEHVERLRRD